VTRNTNTSKKRSIVDERSATTPVGGESRDSSDDAGSVEERAVNDELLATLAEVEP
jgi:hypothetical protein